MANTDEIFAKYPEATLIGATVLDAAGWITQSPHMLMLAVLPEHVEKVQGALLFARNKDWFKAIARQRRAILYGHPALTPAAALADCIKHRHEIWCPDPDDMYVPNYARTKTQLSRAFDALNVRLDMDQIGFE